MGQASVTIDVKAKVMGYEESLRQLQNAFKQIDPGSEIGKKLSKAIQSAETQLKGLSKNLSPRATSETQIDSIIEKTNRAGQAIQEVAALMSNIKIGDIDFSKFDSGINQLMQNLSALEEELDSKVTAGFKETIDKSKELNQAFKDLDIDIKDKNVTQIFDAISKKADEAAENTAKAAKALSTAQKDLAAKQTKLNQLESNPIFHKDELKNDLNNLSKQYEQAMQDITDKIRNGLENNLFSGNQAKADEMMELFTNGLTPENLKDHLILLKDTIQNELKSGISAKEIYQNLFGSDAIGNAGTAPAIVAKFGPIFTDLKQQFTQLFDNFVSSLSNKDAGKLTNLINTGDLTTATTETIKVVEKSYDSISGAVKKGKKDVELAMQAETTAQTHLAEAKTAEQGINDDIIQLRQSLEEEQRKNENLQKQIDELKATITEKKEAIVNNIQRDAARSGSSAGTFKVTTEEANKYQSALDQVRAKEQMVGKLQGVVQRWFSIYAAVRMVSNAIKSVISTVKELDKTITEIAIVTNMTQDQLWNQMSSYTAMARQYASSISGVYKVSQLYYQQGLQTADVMALTEQTLKMARISGLDYADATNYMTNAVRSFKMEMTDAQRVVDVYSEIAASSATSTAELATAMSKTASSAQSVGASFENTTAMMAVMIEATRESAENIGSAMKSIISRYGEMKADPSKLMDSEGEEMSLNKVDKALKSVGISIQDANHQFRDFDDVIMELAGKWDTIDKNTQRYIATIMAGNRQQSRFLALVSNGERLAELSEQAANAEDAATLQVLKTMDSIEAKSQQLKTSLQSLYTSSGVQNLFKDFLDIGNNIVKTFTQMPTIFGAPIPAILKMGTTFASLATIVTTVFGLIKSKIQAQISALNGQEQVAATERVNIAAIEAKQKINYDEERANAAAYFAHQITINEWKEENQRIENERKALEIEKALYEEQKSSFGKSGSIKNTAGVSLGLNIAGVALSTISGALSDKTRGSQFAKGITGLGGSIASMAGMGFMLGGGPQGAIIGGAIGAVMGLIENVNFLFESAEARANRLKEAADEANNKYLQKRAEVKDLGEQLEKLRELEKAQHDSAEARKEFVEASEQLAASHPELIASLDNEGNAVLDLADTYGVLARAREEAGKAAETAAIASLEYAENNLRTAENNKQQAEAAKWTDFYSSVNSTSTANTGNLEKALKNLIGDKYTEAIASEVILRAKIGEDILGYLGSITDISIDTTAQAWQDLAQAMSEVATNPYLTEQENVISNLRSQYNENKVIKPLIDAIETEDTEQIKSYFSEHSEDLKKEYEKTNDAILQNLLESLSELNGGFVEIDASIANASNQLKAQARASLATLISIPFIGSTDETDAFYKEMEGVNDLLVQYMMGQAEEWKNISGNEGKSYSEFFKSEDFDKYFEIISEALGGAWKLLSKAQKDEVNKLIQDKGKYTAQQLQDKLAGILKIDDEEVQNKLLEAYENQYNFGDAIKAIIQRQEQQAEVQKEKLFSGGVLPQLNLGSDELQTYVDTYDKIASMWENDKISLTTAQDAMNRYYALWDATNHNEIAQDLVNSFDDFSLSGVYDFIDKVKESGLAEGLQNGLIEAALSFVDILPTNLETEFQSFSQKISSNMEDFEKALSKASKGMDLKEATEMAQKLDKSLSDFDFKDGKFFFDDFAELRDAYLKENEEYIAQLEIAKREQQENFKEYYFSSVQFDNRSKDQMSIGDFTEFTEIHKKALMERGFNVTELNALYQEYYQNQEALEVDFATWVANKIEKDFNEAIDITREYAANQAARMALSMGEFSEFLKQVINPELFQQDTFRTAKEAMQKGDLDTLIQMFPEYASDLIKYYKDINKGIYDQITAGFKGTEYIQATEFTSNKLAEMELKGLIKKVSGEGDKAIYKTLELKGEKLDEYAAIIASDDTLTEETKQSALAETHKEKFENNIYSAIDSIADNFDSFSYEAGQQLALALGKPLSEVDNLFKPDAAGNLVTSYDDLLEWLNDKSLDKTSKLYLDIRAKLEKKNNELNVERRLGDIISNRDKLNEENIASLAELLNWTYDATIRYLRQNADGTYRLDLSKLQVLINEKKITLTDELRNLIAEEIDNLISSLNGLGNIQNKGTTDIAAMQKQVTEINKLTGEQYSMQDLFSYDEMLHAFVYTQKGLFTSARQIAKQLDSLSDDERWAAEQMLENTRNSFLQNIDVSSLLDAERITPKIEKNILDSIDAFNKYCEAMGDSSHIYGISVIKALKAGGAQAVDIAEKLATIQGKELSAGDVEAAYRVEVKHLVDAIDNVAATTGAIVDETTAELINSSRGYAEQLGNTGQYVVQSAANLYLAYKNLLEELKNTGEATLADINNVTGLMLDNQDGEQAAIDALGDAAGMTYTRLGEIFTSANKVLTEELVKNWTENGILKQLGGNKVQIADFTKFAAQMGWDPSSPEYISAFKTYNDSMIQINRQTERNILEEAQNAIKSKAGDKINLTQLSAQLSKNIIDSFINYDSTGRHEIKYTALDVLEEKLAKYNATLKDGILTLESDVNILGIVQEIQNTAGQYGDLLDNELAELADTVAEVLKNYIDLIANGIKGSLSNVQAGELQSFGNSLGLNLDFTKTVEGLKLSQQSAMQLYNELKKIDALQAQLTLKELSSSLESANEHYANVSTIAARIAELQREIADLKPGDARLQMYKNELAVAQDILRTRSSTDDKSFDFMNRSLPNGMQNPIDYWNATGKAYEVMNASAKSGYMEIQDFYNIVNEMSNMAAISGETLHFMGQEIDGSAETAADLIQKGMSALSNVDGKGVKIALKNLGVDFDTSAAAMKGDFDSGIKEMAKSQIAMLDAAINMLEAMQAMQDIDTSGDGIFDFKEIFGTDDNGELILTTATENWLKQIDAATGGILIGGKTLGEALLELGKINPDAAVRLMNQLNNIDWTLGDANTFAQIQNVLSLFFSGEQITRGTPIYELLEVPSEANDKLTAFNDWCKKAKISSRTGKTLMDYLKTGKEINIRPARGKTSTYFDAISNLLGLDTQGKKDTLEKFAGEEGKLSQREIQLFSSLDIEWDGNGNVTSAKYIGSNGEEYTLEGGAETWQSQIEKLENQITAEAIGGKNSHIATEEEGIIENAAGLQVETIIDAEDKYWFELNGKKYGPYGDIDAAKAAYAEAEKASRSLGETISAEKNEETGEIEITSNYRFVRRSETDMGDKEKADAEEAEKLLTGIKQGKADIEEAAALWFNKDENALEIPGFEKITLKDGEKPEEVLQSLIDELYGPEDFAELPNKIVEGITQAFQGGAGDKIGEAIRTGIENAFKTTDETTGEQSISIPNLTLTPTNVTINLTGSNPATLTEGQSITLDSASLNVTSAYVTVGDYKLGTAEAPVTTVPITGIDSATGEATTLYVNNTTGESESGVITLSAFTANGTATTLTVDNTTGKLSTEEPVNVPILSAEGTITGFFWVDPSGAFWTGMKPGTKIENLKGITAEGKAVSITVECAEDTTGTVTGTVSADVNSAKIVAKKYTVTITNANGETETIVVPGEAELTAVLSKYGTGFDSATSATTSGTINLTANDVTINIDTENATTKWGTWLATQSQNSTIEIQPKVVEPSDVSETRNAVTSDRIKYQSGQGKGEKYTTWQDVYDAEGNDTGLSNRVATTDVQNYLNYLQEAIDKGKTLSETDLSNLEYLREAVSSLAPIEGDTVLSQIIELQTKSEENKTDNLNSMLEIATAFSGLTIGDLPAIATALNDLATYAEKLQNINWTTITDGLTKILGITSQPTEGLNNPNLTMLAGLQQVISSLTIESVEAKEANVSLESPTINSTGTVTMTAATVNVSGTNVKTDNGGGGKTGGLGDNNNNNANGTSGANNSNTNVSPNITSIITTLATTIKGALSGGGASSSGGSNKKTTTVTDNGASDAISKVANAMKSIPTGKAALVTAVANAINSIKSKTFSIKGSISASIDATINATIIGRAGEKVQSFNLSKGTVSTSTSKSISATAKGNVALAKGADVALAAGKRTLMGELGPELVVSNGRYFLVGQDGAEFVNLAPDAIVFNHLQTKKLLQSGKTSRGLAVTNEKNAVSLATGNIEGPARAGVGAAISALKQIRAMWQSLLDASAKDLGAQGGAGRGGGGGGGGGGKGEKNNAGYIHDLEIWYNLVRQIAQLEKEITYQESLQKKIESERAANGKALYESYKKEAEYLKESVAANKQLAALQEDFYIQQIEKVNSSAFGKVFTYDENGLMQYNNDLSEFIKNTTKNNSSYFKNGKLVISGTEMVRDDEGNIKKNKKGKAQTKKFTNELDIANTGLDLLSMLNATDANGKAVYSAEKQVEILKAYGFGNLIKYDSKGKLITGDDKATKMVESFWNQVDTIMKETDTLFDSWQDTEKEVLEQTTKQNELIQKLIDNQIDVENRVVKAIEDREQKVIDELKDQKDKLQEANSKFLDGLNKQLQKEQQMYQQNEDKQELLKLQRQLAILQRSGGSASQIKSLQDQIKEQQKEDYFDAQQQQIDALQEASDNQIERLDTQIEIMQEALDYQKENGLLWEEVYEIMQKSSSEIIDFIEKNTKDFLTKSSLEQEKENKEITNAVELFTSERDDKNSPVKTGSTVSAQTGWDTYLKSISSNAKYKDLVNNKTAMTKAKEAYDASYKQDADDNKAASAANLALDNYIKSQNTPTTTSKNNNQQATTTTTTTKTTAKSTPVQHYKVKTPSGQNLIVRKTGSSSGKQITKWKNGLDDIVLKSSKNKNGYIKVQRGKTTGWVYAKYLVKSKKYAQGGLIDFTGPAWVDGSKSKPESILNAKQTEFLRNELLGSKVTLTNLIKDLQDTLSKTANYNTYNNMDTNTGVNIDNLTMNFNVNSIASDYDAKRASQAAFNEMIKITRKAGNNSVSRR